MGDPNDPAVLLIMGLGAQLLLWRKGFCELLVNQGLRVIRYDNRDVGLSSKFEGRHTGAQAGAADGALLPRQAQRLGVHAGEHGRRRRSAARPPSDREGARRRRLDGRHDRPGLRCPLPAPHQDARGDLLEQQPGATAAARTQATPRHHHQAEGHVTRRGHRQRGGGQQDHRQPRIPGARGEGARRRRRRATTGRTTPPAWPVTSARSWAAAACCTTTS